MHCFSIVCLFFRSQPQRVPMFLTILPFTSCSLSSSLEHGLFVGAIHSENDLKHIECVLLPDESRNACPLLQCRTYQFVCIDIEKGQRSICIHSHGCEPNNMTYITCMCVCGNHHSAAVAAAIAAAAIDQFCN